MEQKLIRVRAVSLLSRSRSRKSVASSLVNAPRAVGSSPSQPRSRSSSASPGTRPSNASRAGTSSATRRQSAAPSVTLRTPVPRRHALRARSRDRHPAVSPIVELPTPSPTPPDAPRSSSKSAQLPHSPFPPTVALNVEMTVAAQEMDEQKDAASSSSAERPSVSSSSAAAAAFVDDAVPMDNDGASVSESPASSSSSAAAAGAALFSQKASYDRAVVGSAVSQEARYEWTVVKKYNAWLQIYTATVNQVNSERQKVTPPLPLLPCSSVVRRPHSHGNMETAA